MQLYLPKVKNIWFLGVKNCADSSELTDHITQQTQAKWLAFDLGIEEFPFIRYF